MFDRDSREHLKKARIRLRVFVDEEALTSQKIRALLGYESRRSSILNPDSVDQWSLVVDVFLLTFVDRLCNMCCG